MYKIIIDVVKEIFIIEISGHLSIENVKDYVVDLNNLTKRFEAKEYSMLIIANRLDPLPQDNIPDFQKAIEIVLSRSNIIAIVNGNRTITLMQMKRIESEARKITNSDTIVMRYKTKNEALKYLLGHGNY